MDRIGLVLLLEGLLVDFSSLQVNNTINICENKVGTISCDNNANISIQTAQYGRFDTSTCPHRAWNTICTGSTQTEYVKKLCQFQTSCNITPSNDVLGRDPCQNVYKYLAIKYQCLAVQSVHENPDSNQTGLIIVVVVSAIILLVIIILLIERFICQKRQKLTDESKTETGVANQTVVLPTIFKKNDNTSPSNKNLEKFHKFTTNNPSLRNSSVQVGEKNYDYAEVDPKNHKSNSDITKSDSQTQQVYQNHLMDDLYMRSQDGVYDHFQDRRHKPKDNAGNIYGHTFTTDDVYDIGNHVNRDKQGADYGML